MASRTRSAIRTINEAPKESSNMCQTEVEESSDTAMNPTDEIKSLARTIERLTEQLNDLRQLSSVQVDASWLTPEGEHEDDDLDALLESDELPNESDPIRKLPPAPKFPSPRDYNFRGTTLPMWLSTFHLTAATVLRRIHGDTSSKRATFFYWMSQINSELNHPELHKILHTSCSSVNATLSEIKNAFGYSQERFERTLRQRVLSFDIGEHELIRPLWQRFKTAYREALRLDLITAGDKTELLEKVRDICSICSTLQERVGVLLRYRIITSAGHTYEPTDPISFDRIASIVDFAIESIEEERGRPLRRDIQKQQHHDRRRDDYKNRAPGSSIHHQQQHRPYGAERMDNRTVESSRQQTPSMGYPIKRPYEHSASQQKVRRIHEDHN